MYLARHKQAGKTHFFIRESYQEGDCFRCRNVFNLGTDPSEYIVYPGGNAYYVEEEVEEALASLNVETTSDDLDDIFWPFVKPEIRRAVEHFRHRTQNMARNRKMTDQEQCALRSQVHLFDKRRILYLRCGGVDQGGIGRIPGKMIMAFAGKSRDEIEQSFMTLESCLQPYELKTYIYTALDLQRFFPDFTGKKLPEALDQDALDRHFQEEICRLHVDNAFWIGQKAGDVLHEYLVRYVTMFFDNDFGRSSLLDDYVKDFMNRHRARSAPKGSAPVSLDEASAVFQIKKNALRAMTTRGLTRLYRRMAKKFHPDKGGTHEGFVQLTRVYEELMRNKGAKI